MNIGEVCSRQPVTIGLSQTVTDAARLMRARHVGALIVIDDRAKPVGIVTDRDLVLKVLANPDKRGADTIESIMTVNPIVCTKSDLVFATIRKMRSSGVRRIPVVDDDGSACGVFTLDDSVDYLSQMLGELVGVIKGEFNRERSIKR